MKIHKVYEKLHENADKLSIVISSFFNELEEFDRDYYNSIDGKKFKFTICFTEIYKETVEQMEKFNDFFDLVTDGWSFKLNDNKEICEEFYLNYDDITKYLNKFEMLKKANKYNV